MAAIPVRNFATLVQNFAAAAQGRAAILVDFSVGAVLRAVAEATADMALWLQSQIVYVLSLTRAATSKGADLDSWVNDFGIVRLASSPATGLVTFSRFTPSADALIPVGTGVQTTDGSIKFTVVADGSNPSYSDARQGYLLPLGVAELAVPVVANFPTGSTDGSKTNVVAGAITVVTSTVPYVDTVRNTADFANGTAAETDAALQARKTRFFASLSKGTSPAIAYAVESLQLGVQYRIVENQNRDGSTNNGFVYVVIDDGTGNPPASLIGDVTTAVYAVRASGIRYAVFPPTLRDIRIELQITSRFGYDPIAVEAAVAEALSVYVNGLGLGVGLPWSVLTRVAYDASPGVANVSGLTIDGTTTDIPAVSAVTIKTQTVIASVISE